MNRVSQVKEATGGSVCRTQCDSSIGADKLGLLNAVAGCGETRGVHVCILRDPGKCPGIRTTRIASRIVAECEVCSSWTSQHASLVEYCAVSGWLGTEWLH